MTTPEEVKAAREEAGLTQAEAAALVYIAKNTWQKWEYGERRIDEGTFELFMIKTKAMQELSEEKQK